MGYKVRVQKDSRASSLKRDYGTGREGKGTPYKTEEAAERRAKSLRREFWGFTVKVVRAKDLSRI